MYAKIALTGLARRKGRTFFTAFAIAIALSMAILLVSVGVGLKQGAALTNDPGVDYWIIPPDSSVTDLVSNSETTMLGDVHQSIKNISQNSEIQGATPVLNRLIYASSGNDSKVIMGIGAIPGRMGSLPAPAPGLTQGDPYFSGENWTGEAVINEKTGQLLGVKEGDMLQLGVSGNSINTSFKVVGVITSAEYSISPIVLLHLSELQELTGNLKGDRANYIIVRGTNALSLLQGLFPTALVLSSDEFSAYSIVSDKKILATTIAVSAVSLIIAVLFISSTMILSINEKQHEFSVMRAIGVSRRSISKIVIYESVFLSLLGAILGIVFSILGEKILNIAAYDFFDVGTVSVVDPILLLGGVVVAIGAGVFSGLIPVMITRRIGIVTTLG